MPLIYEDTKDVLKNFKETEWKCERKSRLKINRFDETSIQLNWTEVGYKPRCYFRQLSRGSDDFHFNYGMNYSNFNQGEQG